MLDKNRYVITKETLLLVLDALVEHWFNDCDDEISNDDVILATTELNKEIDRQNEY